MSRAGRGRSAKTDNKKYVERGAALIIEYDPEWEDDVRRANEGKVGAPYRYAETLIMLAAGVRVAPGVRYRQLQGMVGKTAGRSNTPSFSQFCKRINRLDADVCRGPDGMVTVSDRRGPRVLALDASGLKQHNRGEWMRAKWKVRRGFVKMHVLVDTDTMKILALEVTDDTVGDSTMFESLLGQVADAGGAQQDAGGAQQDAGGAQQDAGGAQQDAGGAQQDAGGAQQDAGGAQQDAGGAQQDAGGAQQDAGGAQQDAGGAQPPAAAPPDPRDGRRYENLLASGVPPLASFCPGDGRASRNTPDLLLGDAAYGSRKNIAACARAGVTPGIAHTVNVTARGKGSGDAWGISVRDQMGGSPDATRLDLMDREEKRENQVYWKVRIGYGHRWLVEAVFSVFKRLFGEHLMALKWDNIVQEIRLKVIQYNKWRDESIAREAGGETS